MAVNNGLYNMLFSENEYASKLLELLELDRSMFGRYRDCYTNADGTKIIVLTRCGGSNRQDYDIVFDTMRKHKNYLGDYDDKTDETYCYFEFGVPFIFKDEVKEISNGIEPLTVGEKFEKELAEMDIPGSEAEKRAKKIAYEINKKMQDNPNSSIIYIGDPDWKMTKRYER